MRWMQELDKRNTAGRPKAEDKLAPHGANLEQPTSHGKSSHDTAAVLGIGSRTVERVRTIIDHAPEEIKEAVEQNKITINKAYNETQKLRKQEAEKAEGDEMGKGEDGQQKTLSISSWWFFLAFRG